jgi:hypothetical protein
MLATEANALYTSLLFLTEAHSVLNVRALQPHSIASQRMESVVGYSPCSIYRNSPAERRHIFNFFCVSALCFGFTYPSTQCRSPRKATSSFALPFKNDLTIPTAMVPFGVPGGPEISSTCRRHQGACRLGCIRGNSRRRRGRGGWLRQWNCSSLWLPLRKYCL